jgi:hypothetical protein
MVPRFFPRFDTQVARRENAQMIRNDKASFDRAATTSSVVLPLLGLALLLTRSGRCGSHVGA